MADNMVPERLISDILYPPRGNANSETAESKTQMDYEPGTDIVEAVRNKNACFIVPLEKPYKANPGTVMRIAERLKIALIKSGEVRGLAEETSQRVRDEGFRAIMADDPAMVSRAVTQPLLQIHDLRKSTQRDPFQH